MNIFVFSFDPAQCARWHCDRHINSQIKEMCQMMGTAYRLAIPHPADSPVPKITHANHPCSVWLRESTNNWMWGYELLRCLFREKRRRFFTPHAYEEFLRMFHTSPFTVPIGCMTPFAQAMPEQYRQSEATQAYRAYFCGAKRHLAKWYGNQIPHWYL